MIRTGRKIAIILLPSLTLVSGVLLRLDIDYRWLDWIFKICLSGTVGIWTNYFAIKMLFRPYRRTVFGRQGLIPARRGELAEAIASAVADELLDTDAILQYVEENDLVDRTATSALEYVHKWVDDPDNRTMVTETAAKYIRSRGEEQVEKFLSRAAEFLREYASDKVSAEEVWSYARSAIETELEKPENLKLLTMVVTRLIEKNASALSDAVNSMLEDWINSQSFIVKNALKLGKGLFGVDSNKIRKELLKRAHDPGFVKTIMNVLEENVSSLTEMGDDPEVRKRFEKFLEEQKSRLFEWVKTEGVTRLRKKILDYLRSESFWDWLEKQLDSAIVALKDYADKKVSSEEFRRTASEFLFEHLNKIEIRDIVRRKVNEFDLKKLEELINKVSGENLCGIELFGGLLGMLAGLILIDQWFVIGLPMVIALLWLAERRLSGKAPS